MASVHAQKPRKDGTVPYKLTWRDNGKQNGQTFDTEAEANMWKGLLEAAGENWSKAEKLYDAHTMDGPTVQEAMTAHVDQLVGTTPYTLKRYRDAIRIHFDGPLGRMKVKAVTYDSIIEWIKWMQARELSPKTISDKHGLLSATFETQVRHQVISHNPCKGVRLPKKSRVGDDGDNIDMDDYKAIYARMDPHFRPFMDFLLGTGCRFSEATALVGKDFSLEPIYDSAGEVTRPPLVYITKAHKLGGEGEARYVGAPKSAKSRRKVSLAPSTVFAVRPLVEAALRDNGPVFRMKEGGVLSAQAFYHRAWKQARDGAGFTKGSNKHVTVHSIRHLHASAMLHNGFNMYELSARLGHSDINITLGIYAHALPGAQFAASQVAAKMLGEVPEIAALEA